MVDDAQLTLTPHAGSLLYPRPAIAAAPRPGRRVAIILRTRDRPLLLTRALAGIAAQTHPDWHLYLVNDGGDASAVQRAAAVLDGRASVIDRPAPPHGPWPAAQAGLDAIQGEDLVCLHDDDDSWEPGFLAAVTGFLADPAHAGHVAVSTGCTLIEEEVAGGTVRERWRCAWPHGQGLVEFGRALVDAQIPPISLAYRRDALLRAGGFDPRLDFAGDWEVLLRLLLLGEIGHVPVPLANYHHRVRGADGRYGNTVVEQKSARGDQHILLRNAMLRAGLRDRPEAIGLLQTLLRATEAADPHARIDRLSEALSAGIRDARAGMEHAVQAGEERAMQATQAAAASTARAVEEAAAAMAAAQAEALAALRGDLAQIAARLDQIDGAMHELREVASWQRRMLRPFRALWRAALPLRRVIARARGRVPAAQPAAAPRRQQTAQPQTLQRRLLDLPVIGPILLRREMIRRYTSYQGHPPQLDPPRGFNAHIIDRILHDRDPRLKILCDKWAIRPLIREALGEDLLPPLHGAWEDPAEVPWDTIPLPFVMKPSHSSGLILFVHGPAPVDTGMLIGTAQSWLDRDYFDASFEWGYRGIPRRVLVQPVLLGPDGAAPAEAQVFTFGGRASHIRVFTAGRDNERRRDNWFSTDGTRIPMRLRSAMGDYVLDPALARQLVGWSERMAADMVHLRVDFLLTAEGPKLSELTTYTFAGAAPFHPPEKDLELGELWEEAEVRLGRR